MVVVDLNAGPVPEALQELCLNDNNLGGKRREESLFFDGSSLLPTRAITFEREFSVEFRSDAFNWFTGPE